MYGMRGVTDGAHTEKVLSEGGAVEALPSASTSCSTLPCCQGMCINVILTTARLDVDVLCFFWFLCLVYLNLCVGVATQANQ